MYLPDRAMRVTAAYQAQLEYLAYKALLGLQVTLATLETRAKRYIPDLVWECKE